MRDKAYEIIESLNRFRRKVLGGEELKAFLCINAFIGQKFVVEEDYECGFIHNMSMNRARKLGLKVSLSNKYVIPRGSELILRKKYRNMYVFTLKGFDITINDFRYLYLSSDDNMLSTSEFASEDEANEFIRNHGITDYEIHDEGGYCIVKYLETQSIKNNKGTLKKKPTQKSYTWKKLVKENLIGYYWIVSYSVDNNAKEGYVYYVREEDAQKSEKAQRERGFGHKRVIKVYFDGKGLK